MTDRPTRLWWAVYPPVAVAGELGIPLKIARRLVAAVQRRRRPLSLVAIPAAFVLGAGGWLGLLAAITTVYEQVTLFNPDGSVASTSTTGPFGITSYPLAAAAVLGFGLAWLLGSILTLAAQEALIGREARRCTRTPACFICGYDLSAVRASECPECGTPRVGEAPPRTVAS